jgi:hypothetical protein
MALLGAVIVIGLIVFAIVRVRNKRDQAEARNADEGATGGASGHQKPDESHDHRHSGSARHH